MPLCMRLKEENTPCAKERHKRRLGTPYKSVPYNQRSVMTVQQNKEKEDMAQREKRQFLSQMVLNRFPVPFQPAGTMTDLLSVFSKESSGKLDVSAKYRSHNITKEEYDKLATDILESEDLNDIQTPPLLRLHMACTLANPSPFVSSILDDGASVNQRNNHGQTPLHLLILSGVTNPSSKDALQCLLCRGASLTFKDGAGDSPLLCVRYLLKEKQYENAAHVARCLLEAGANVHSVDSEKQTLLSYSLQHVDSAIGLTRTLFNYGASVWGHDHPVRDDNAFKWLLKGIMRQRKLDNCKQSLELVGQLMCNHPAEMESLILRTMIRHSRYYQVYGPLFLGIQKHLKRFWKEPQRLSDLCRSTLRESLCLDNSPMEAVKGLDVPPVIKSYLLLDDDITTAVTEKHD